ncbi:hypothetical protein BH09ACT12_BH09ACT12_12830 [soil metagenome]
MPSRPGWRRAAEAPEPYAPGVTSTPLRRRATVAAAVLSLAFALTACGSDGGDEEAADDTTSAASPEPTDEPTDAPTDEPSGDTGAVLTEDEMTPALLTTEDLPGGFVVDPDDGDDSSTSFAGSCLEDISDLTDRPEFDADAKAEASYVLDGDAGQSSVRSQVQSYADAEQVVSAIDMFSAAVADCTSAAGTDDDGFEYDLEVLSDQTVSLTGVDQQARVAIQGTFTSESLELPLSIGYNVARIAGNLVIISTIDVGEVGDGIVSSTDTIGQISVDRLSEVTGVTGG